MASRFSFSSGGSSAIWTSRSRSATRFSRFGNFFLGHLREFGSLDGGELAIVVQLLARGFEFAPFAQQFLDAGMLAHGFAGAFPVVEKVRIGDLAFQLLEAFPFALDEGLKIHKQITATPKAVRKSPFVRRESAKLSCAARVALVLP